MKYSAIILIALGSTLLIPWVWCFGWVYIENDKIKGIDISHHQKPINWKMAKEEGIRFVYIKTTEGSNWSDTSYKKHMESARSEGILVGSYHFFTFCKDGETQAQQFLSHIDLQDGDLLPVVDVESGGNCHGTPDKQKLNKELIDFINEIHFKTGVFPIIYTTQKFYSSYFRDGFNDSKFWIRNLFWKPSQKQNWIFWQYEVSFLKGATMRVDRNVFYGGEKDFKKLLFYNR